jgi:hypothetical protein
MSSFKFGNFDYICEHAALVVCPMVGTAQGTMPTCYARNVQLGSQIIFQPGTSITLAEFQNVPVLIISNMFCPHCRTGNDGNHAFPLAIEIYCGWT